MFVELANSYSECSLYDDKLQILALDNSGNAD